MTTDITTITQEVSTALSDKQNAAILIATTFNGMPVDTVRRAMIEGMLRGFTLRDFLEKNVYAIPFKDRYSLVTSIDHARKIGMRSGICGKSAPRYTEKDGKVISCEVTVQRMVNGHVGDFTALVYFSEYDTRRNLWASKPRTMIAKVAEMHALRMACPEEMSQLFSEEELEREVTTTATMNMDEYEQNLLGAKTIDELAKVWSALPAEAKSELVFIKDEAKAKLIDIPKEEIAKLKEGGAMMSSDKVENDTIEIVGTIENAINPDIAEEIKDSFVDMFGIGGAEEVRETFAEESTPAKLMKKGIAKSKAL